RWIERARLHLQQILRLPSDGQADAVAVLRPPLEGPEDEHVERALQQLESAVVRSLGHGCRQSTALDGGGLGLVPGRDAGPEGPPPPVSRGAQLNRLDRTVLSRTWVPASGAAPLAPRIRPCRRARSRCR